MRCRHCRIEIGQIDYGSGPEWVHTATHPDPKIVGPYSVCTGLEPRVATPPKTLQEWMSELSSFSVDDAPPDV